MPFFHNGEWHLYYLKPPKGAWDPIERSLTSMAYMKSKDLVCWEEMADCFTIGEKGEPDEKGCWTGCVVEQDGRFHFFYTGYDPNKQRQNICKAISTDLKQWEKIADNPILEADERHYEIGDWRDPFVYWDDELNHYVMMIVARNKSGPFWNRGCIAIAFSTDLDNWVIQNPELSKFPKHQSFCPECPELFKLGNYWYYVVSRFSESQQTIYFVSSHMNGPWERRRLDSLEGRRFYASKSASYGTKQVTFGWIPFRENDADDGVFAWGGTFGSPRELVSENDGTLTMRLAAEVDESYSQIQPLRISHNYWGKWSFEERKVVIEAENEYAYGFFNTRERADVLFETSITLKADGTRAGILIEVDEDMSSGYFLAIDPLQQNVIFNKWPEHQDFHWEAFLVKDNPGLNLNQEVDNPLVVRPLAFLPKNDNYNIKILRKDSAIECYIANQVCATFRIYRNDGIPFGIFVSGGTAIISDTHLRN